MPYSNFIQVKRMEGELLLSQKRNRLGCTLTTRELIFQKPHASYQIMLSDTLGILPYKVNRKQETVKNLADTEVYPLFTNQYYRITASRLYVINRNGRFERDSTDLLVPLTDRFIRYIARYTDLVSVSPT
ncbi:hypothetical protein C8P63_12840 [Melghirimyces profundicolus]|uniref:Uncharacterized protein n=1 Tax=Melghirimyces profundicolus TaxID=1242148 RepID=A0A2T6BC90_9BACL|nr:hypothetical protein [Melghirimyces profundicolus]PTX53677.1 hypothetical protein C8P63_12840 [Melghirimyces profundicolus]